MQKDPTITELLDWLGKRLGGRFTITDRWEADRCAIGISTPKDSRQLVYISGYEQPVGRYSVELESTPAQGSEAPYQNVGNFELLSREELLGLITKHLDISK